MKALKFKLLFCYIVLTLGCSDRVDTISPKVQNIIESVYASGTVVSEDQYNVYSTSNRIIKTVFVEDGQFVRKGDPLFEIENVNSTLGAANALLLATANDYDKNQLKIEEALDFIELAKKKSQNDSLLWLRQKEMWALSIGSKVELEQRELSFENSKSNLKKAQVAYEELKKQVQLSSEQSKNNFKISKSIADELIIRSEIEGYVYKINVNPGEFATSNTVLASIGKENFVLELNVDEFDIVKIEKGQKVLIKMDSYKNQSFEAEIKFIHPMMNERTRIFKVEAFFTKQPKILYPNLSLEANIIIKKKMNVLTIPTTYLLNDSNVVLENGQIKKVKIGLKDINLVEIIHGLNKGSKIRKPDNEK